MLDNILHGECLELMCNINDCSVDMILCDLPYGTTACKWDTIISFKELWLQYDRIIKDSGCVALFGSEPFSSHLRLSNLNYYKYDWVWEKSKASNYVHSKYQPLKSHETISIFSKKPAAQNTKHSMNYYPIFTDGVPYKYGVCNGKDNEILSKGTGKHGAVVENSSGKRYPRSVQYFKTAESEGALHPTQKPILLCEYLIKTYTKENEVVLDNCAGSGTTLLAAKNLNRRFIGIEKEKKYYDICLKRLNLL